MRTRIDIENDMLIWAVERAGFELPEAVARMPNLHKWLQRERKPTVKQLESFAKKFFVPFGYLLLDEPPEEKLPIPFFRTADSRGDIPIHVKEMIKKLKFRQDWMRDYLINIEEAEPLEFIGKYTLNDNHDIIIKDIRQTLKLQKAWTKNSNNTDDAFKHLINAVEEAGIFTSIAGYVGNNTRRVIETKDCRGFVLVDKYAPFIFVNGRDYDKAQIFTMIHELVHLWIGQSAGFNFRELQPPDNRIENFCNRTAAELLLPEEIVREEWSRVQDHEVIAAEFNLSKAFMLRRLLDLDIIDKSKFNDLYSKLIKGNLPARSGGGNFHLTKRKKLGLRFSNFVKRAVKNNQLLYRDAYKLTDLSSKSFQIFMAEYIN